MINSKIKKLSDSIIKNIVAGEIINSPACVLKELMENSLDASSSKVIIYIENFGLNLIKVIDNGDGIYKQDLYNACSRYNTSKISKWDDLNKISTYGFRGEALFAIQSIADLEIISKPFYQEMAWSYFSDKLLDKKIYIPTSGNKGTTIIIKNLLSHIKLFSMKKNFFFDIYFVFKILALSNFDVHFILFNNGIEYKNLPICLDHYSKIKRMDILGEKCFFPKSFDIYFNKNGIKLYGFISFSYFKQTSVKSKFFFVNNRFIDDNLINTFINNILKKYVKKNEIINYCLYLYLDSSLININLNSKKTNFKFMPASLYSFINNALFEVLSNNKNFILRNFNNDSILRLDNIKTNILSHDNYNILNNSLSKDMIFDSGDKILTLLNNMYLFFKIENNVFIVLLKSLRSKILFNVCIDQFLKYGKLFSKKVNIFKKLNINKKKIIYLYKKNFNLYGFSFKYFYDDSIIINFVPEVLYNFLIHWEMLISDMLVLFSKNIVNNFSISRFDINIINLFIKHIYVKSLCYKHEIDMLYKKLLYFKINDEKWFIKNCLKFFCNNFKF